MRAGPSRAGQVSSITVQQRPQPPATCRSDTAGVGRVAAQWQRRWRALLFPSAEGHQAATRAEPTESGEEGHAWQLAAAARSSTRLDPTQ